MGVRIPPPLPCIDIDGQGWDDMGVLKRAQEFFGEVLAEFRKVTWPNRQELINSTVVVITVTVVIAFFLGGVDIVLARIVERDRKSTRLNSSHGYISYAVFCLKKKK